MSDLFQLTGPAAIEWLHESGHPVAAVYAFVAHGITDTSVITSRIDMHEIVAALPDDARLTADDLGLLQLIGPRAWYEDPDNRGDWAAVANALADLADNLTKRDPTRHPWRRLTSPQDVIAAVLDADRGPSYAQRMIAVADRHLSPVDAFGFQLSPTDFDDLLGAGLRLPNDFKAYRSLGLTIPEIVEFAADGIPPAAIMQAKAEGIHRTAWRETLTGLARNWFRKATDLMHDEDFASWEYFISANGDKGYTIADLRYLADRGWDNSAPLYVWGVSSMMLPMTPETSRTIADQGVTWRVIEEYGKALGTGKAPQHSSDATVAPIIGGGGGRAWGLKMEHVPGIAAMVAAGIRTSHISAYRSAGCSTIDEIVDAAKRGITHKEARRLTKTYGRKPSRHREVYVIDTYAQLIRAHQKDQEKTP